MPENDSAIDNWLERFDTAVRRSSTETAALFEPDGFWRDLLSFTWNIQTMEGRASIESMLQACSNHTKPRNWRRDGHAEITEDGIAAWVTFETESGWGRGRVVLRDDLCHIFFTMLADLKGHEEPLGANRKTGFTDGQGLHQKTWSDTRAHVQKTLGITEQPYVVIIGGGQGGVALAARLKQLDVPTLVIEKNARIGDSWRNRYRTLVLHDPVWYDHLPYLPFPENWPVFSPKDKIGDWLEAYASIFELDTWTSTECTRASFDERKRVWTVTVRKQGKDVILSPRHLVFCTGAYGPPRRANFVGSKHFTGTILHSADYQSGAEWSGKRALVIGAGSSAHDVAKDLHEAGAHVTMNQRRPSIVVRSEMLMKYGFDLYSEDAVRNGITTETADLLSAATPFALMPEKHKRIHDTIREEDVEFYDALAASGFSFDFGEDDSGLMVRATRTASGYYIDVGASTMIAEGQISVIAEDEIEHFTPNGVRFRSGREEPYDLVVACIGYQSMNEAVALLVDRDTADLVGPCWGLGSGIEGDPGPWLGELRNMWKPTAHEALWFHGGNLALSRFYSKIVAVQLKARFEGIPTPVYRRPHPHR